MSESTASPDADRFRRAGTLRSLKLGALRVSFVPDGVVKPVQISNPEWPLMGDRDPGGSIRTRRSVLELLAEPTVIGFGIHFADVVFGTVSEIGLSHTWVPLD